MSSGKRLSALLLLSTALTFPAAALAQSTGAEGPPPTEEEVPDEELTQDIDAANETVPGDIVEEEAQPDISIPGGTIVVTGRRNRDVTRASPQVVTVLDTATIARTGEGDIAGALGRTTGLSEQGGLVYVRGLGDRYSLALLNGLPLPSPQPLSRVVPLDIFPTSVVASSLVQKTYSANFPGEFGGGVVNLTTRAIPTESFLTVSGSLSGDSETTFGPGYTYFGSGMDWTGFDEGRRKVEYYDALQGFFDSGARISDDGVDIRGILKDINDPNLYLVQKLADVPANFSAGLTAGTSFDVGSDGMLGIIATASISNKWRNRFITKQTAANEALELDTDFREFATDNRVLTNALLGFGLELGEHKFRFTNLFIHDTLKRASLEEGTDFQDGDSELNQSTSWFERQLINSQFVGELEFGNLSLDLRGGYAQTQREAPFEWEFSYVRTNNESDPYGDLFINTLNPQRGGATVAFSDLTEDLWFGGADVGYFFSDFLSATVGFAYTDTERLSTRRQFDIRSTGDYPTVFGAFRPDNLLGDALIDLGFDRDAQDAAGLGPFGYAIFETTGSDPAFAAALEVWAGYGKVNLRPFDRLTVDLGVRYEDATQSVEAVEVFAEPLGSTSGTLLENDYWLPGGTLTWELTDALQFRASASKTIARPQFRELIFQTYFDPETNRQFNGNPRLIDSELTNYEARLEYYMGGGSRASLAGFYKDIENPIEVFTSFSDNAIISGFANAPQAELYGAEVEFQYNIDLFDLGGWFDSQQLVTIANYTYTQSEISVGDGDIARVFPFADQPATNFFDDGTSLTGQSDHLVNLQLGLEDLDRLSQFTLLLKYASERVTSRGAGPLPDIIEEPGLSLDFVIRQGFEIGGKEVEMKLEARNLTGTDHEEFQTNGDTRIEINSYDVGRSFSIGASMKF
ncbi:TonB-dependent receptor domain-containing protein [Qipengyuania sphaerica]|uniref:TonB-dependent receptor domain-containing protein n=1 Tax=Qipengyuania sphaerica TaxID=2867243 RepID=UPI001C872F10|nr:TonB-dependent receptor [Qipengyuania sphaerica]MBX7541212.1 TonB-dependent receptor [Qipengyuania sphaerica]